MAYHTKTLGEHQLYAIECMKDMSALCIWYEAGTGKTIIALTWLVDALKNGKINDALVVVPAALVSNWENDIEHLTDFTHIEQKDVELLKRSVTITSYQKTYHSVKTVKIVDGQPKEKYDHPLRPEVDKFWGAVIYDEAHGLSSHKSAQLEAALTLAKLSKYRYEMTGTPISGSTANKGEDLKKLYGQLKFIDDNIWKNWSQFCRRYVIAMNQYYVPTQYKVEELHALMYKYAIVCRLQDCVDLPECIIDEIPCPVAERKAYDDIKHKILKEYGLRRGASGTTWPKLMQLCSGHFKNLEGIWSGKCSKEDVLLEVLNGTEDSVVIFATFTETINRIEQVCKKADRKALIFDGKHPKADWKDFASGKYDTIVCQYAKGCEGLNLQNSHTLVWYEPPRTLREYEQSKARIRRTGQKEVCRYVCLSTPNSVESKMWECMFASMEVTDEMFDEWVNSGVI